MRIVNVDAIVASPRHPDPKPRILDLLPAIVRIEQIPDFRTRYLVEGLLSQGLVTVLEVEDLLKSVSKLDEGIRSSVLEGLFRWTRQGKIGRDVIGRAHKSHPR